LVDAESIATRLDRLSQLLEQLETIRASGRDAYRSDFRSRLAAAHAIQLSVQICIDIGAHLIAELGLQAPSDYRGIFTGLLSAGLEPELAERLAEAVGMRNILVHGYLEVDDEAVWDALGRLDDLRRFAAFAQGQIS
jgi:uncharacterized protein YutE (UPF0331/DUF86 family)